MTKDVVIKDLAIVQAGLCPAWHDVSKRHHRVLYLKSKLTNKRQNELIPYNDCLYRNMYRLASSVGALNLTFLLQI